MMFSINWWMVGLFLGFFIVAYGVSLYMGLKIAGRESEE